MICADDSTVTCEMVSAVTSAVLMAAICAELRPDTAATLSAVALVAPSPAIAAVCNAET